MQTISVGLTISAVDKATAPLRGVASALGGLGKTLGGVARSFSFGIGAGAGMAAFEGLSRLASTITSLPSQIIQTSAQFENFAAILETTEGSAEKARKALDWAQKFANLTPYELDGVTEAFVRMRAYGLEPTKGLMQTLGDTASAMDKPLMQAVEAIADAVTGENERLKEFGIKASKSKGLVSFAFTDKEGKQQVKTVKDNNRELIQSTLQTIWNSKYQGAMDKRSKTWDGMLSNVSGTWTTFLQKIGAAGVFDEVKKQLSGFLDLLNQMAGNGALDRVAKAIGETLGDAVRWSAEGFRGLWAQLSKWADPGGQARDVADVLNKLGTKLAPTFRDAASALGDFRDIMSDVAKTAAFLAEKFSGVVGVVRGVMNFDRSALASAGAISGSSSTSIGGLNSQLTEWGAGLERTTGVGTAFAELGRKTLGLLAPSVVAPSAAAAAGKGAAASPTIVNGKISVEVHAGKGTEAKVKASSDSGVSLVPAQGYSMVGW